LDHFEHGVVFLEHQVSSITAVVQYHIRLPIFSRHAFIDAPPEIFLGFTTPRKHRISGVRQRCGYLVLCGINVARRPSHLRAEFHQCFNQNGSLRVDMSASHNLGVFQRLCKDISQIFFSFSRNRTRIYLKTEFLFSLKSIRALTIFIVIKEKVML